MPVEGFVLDDVDGETFEPVPVGPLRLDPDSESEYRVTARADGDAVEVATLDGHLRWCLAVVDGAVVGPPGNPPERRRPLSTDSAEQHATHRPPGGLVSTAGGRDLRPAPW